MENFIYIINRFKDFVLDLFFPKECLGCQKEGRYLCGECLEQIELNKDFYCALCKQKSTYGLVCPSCRQNTVIKAIWVAADYNNKLLQDLIHALKYQYIEGISESLAALVLEYLRQTDLLRHFEINPAHTIIVPVPLHRKRILTRGFNQSELISDNIGKILIFEKVNLLKRIKNTETQINLKRLERQQNVTEAFNLSNIPFDITKKVILVDDVVTTGSTLKECASVLANAGFKEIYGLVIAQRED